MYLASFEHRSQDAPCHKMGKVVSSFRGGKAQLHGKHVAHSKKASSMVSSCTVSAPFPKGSEVYNKGDCWASCLRTSLHLTKNFCIALSSFPSCARLPPTPVHTHMLHALGGHATGLRHFLSERRQQPLSPLVICAGYFSISHLTLLCRLCPWGPLLTLWLPAGFNQWNDTAGGGET